MTISHQNAELEEASQVLTDITDGTDGILRQGTAEGFSHCGSHPNPGQQKYSAIAQPALVQVNSRVSECKGEGLL